MIDYRLARGESAAEWERFLAGLHKRGLTSEGLDMICVDGGSGLLAALPMVYDKIPVQRFLITLEARARRGLDPQRHLPVDRKLGDAKQYLSLQGSKMI